MHLAHEIRHYVLCIIYVTMAPALVLSIHRCEGDWLVLYISDCVSLTVRL